MHANPKPSLLILSPQLVGLYSSAFAAAHGVAVTPANFQRVCVAFAARRLVRNTLIDPPV